MKGGPETTTDEVLRGVDLSGRIALVTGASSGLGEETTRALASAGADVVMAVRNHGKGEAAVERLRQAVPGAGLELGTLDLSSLDSVRTFAEEVLARHPSLQLLVNNAGVMACPFGRTADGFELQFGTNHLGHFLLTGLLAPALLAGAPARVVNLSSRGHLRSDIDWDDPNYERRPYEKWAAYGQSKTANVLFSVELDRRLGPRGVHAYAVHPGVIMTELARHLTEDDIRGLSSRAPGGRLSMKPVEAGAATTVWAATAVELEGRGGLYLEDCHVGEEATSPESSEGHAPYATDPAAATRLWALSEELVGERFPF